MATSTKNQYKNPTLQVEKRVYLNKDSREFKNMLLIHEEFSNDKSSIIKYCASCHILLTRAGNLLHQNCENIFSSSSIVGIFRFLVLILILQREDIGRNSAKFHSKSRSC